MTEREIATIIGYKWVAKVGKYIVKLGFVGEHAEEVWMTEKQLDQLEKVSEKTENGWSSRRCAVIGLWNERGYYAYAKLEKTGFVEPVQYNLSDLEDK